MSTVIDDVRANEQVYERLRPELEKTHPGQWVVILNGELVAVGATREEAARRPGASGGSASCRLVRRIGDQVPKEVRKL